MICLIIALILLIITAVLFFWQNEYLTAECRGTILFAWPVRAGETFELTFTHSVNQSPITDVIEWTGEDLSVVKSIFKTFGAGVPVPADGVGTELVFVDGHYELIGIDKHMKGFSVITQETPNQKIIFNGREADLIDITGPGKPVYITVRRLPFFLVSK